MDRIDAHHGGIGRVQEDAILARLADAAPDHLLHQLDEIDGSPLQWLRAGAPGQEPLDQAGELLELLERPRQPLAVTIIDVAALEQGELERRLHAEQRPSELVRGPRDAEVPAAGAGEVRRGRTPPQNLLEHPRHDPHRCRRRVGRDPHQHDGVARVHDLGALDAEQHPRELLGDGLVRRPGRPGSPREGGKGGAQLAPGLAPDAPDVRQPQVRRVVGGAPHGDGGAEAVRDETRDRPQRALGRTGGGDAPADRDGLADRPQLAPELLGTTDVVKGDRELARDGAQRLPAPRDRVDRRDDLEHPQALATGDERQHREHGTRWRGELEPHRPAGDEHGPAARRPLATGLPQPGVRPRGAEPASGVGQRDLDVRCGDPQGGANPGWGRGDGLLLGLRRGERVAQGPQHRSLVLPGGGAGRAFDATQGGASSWPGPQNRTRSAFL